ncbi:MAG: hypothetical protein EOP88_20055 [Verrucomicrobiaceae bacterium]|nr:MAG: hypothetical protein EOP88_20055 [Verrucomicrobiaceae bacterium]
MALFDRAQGMWHDVKCENCKGFHPLREGLPAYALPGEQTLYIQQAPAWCRQCAVVVLAERIPAIDELTDPAAVAWRQQRISPAKCLTCGSPDIIPSKPGLTHSGRKKHEIGCPVCGGVIRIFEQPSLTRQGCTYHSPEGDLLKE